MEIFEIQKVFKPIKTVMDVQRIQRDIDEINILLSTIPFNDIEARKKIYKINGEHPENTLIYKLLFPPTGNAISIDQAPSDGLIQDLSWKRDYLSIKSKTKSLDEVIQQLKSMYQNK